jgi:predicted phosphodiesterase
MSLLRFAIVGDIHAEHETLSEVLDFVRDEDVEVVLAVGDIADGRGSVTASCRLLADAGVVAVRGNHERWFLAGTMRELPGATLDRDVDAAARAFLSSLPATRRIPTARGDLLLCHGTGEDDMTAVTPDAFGYALETNDALQKLLRDASVRWMVSGHSHRRMVRRIGPLTIINAGTLHRDHSPCFGIVDLGAASTVTFFERTADGRMVTAEVLPLPHD